MVLPWGHCDVVLPAIFFVPYRVRVLALVTLVLSVSRLVTGNAIPTMYRRASAAIGHGAATACTVQAVGIFPIAWSRTITDGRPRLEHTPSGL